MTNEETPVMDGEAAAAGCQPAAKSLEPADAQQEFTRTCRDFWTMLQHSHRHLQRRQFWAARQTFHVHVLNYLLALLRLVSGRTERWQARCPADEIETVVDQEDLSRLNSCIPGRNDGDIRRAMQQAAEFCLDICSQIEQEMGWEWPQELGRQVTALLQPGISGVGSLPPVSMTPIGIVHNEVEELLPPKEIKAYPSTIVVDPALSDGLDGLTANQRLLVVFQFHRLSGYKLHQHPKNNPALPKQGVFALHSPLRPNSIGVTEVELVKRDGNVLHVRGLDAVNGTPVLDLKLNS